MDVPNRCFMLLSPEEQAALMQAWSEPPFRIKQIRKWVLERRITAWQDMTDLPMGLRTKLQDSGLAVIPAYIIGVLASGWATKYAIQLADAEIVEAVAMSYDYGTSVCVSTQVGCKMACAFCASAQGGYVRNLTAWEMLSQVILAGHDHEGRANTHVVLMGIGEPLENYDEVVLFIRMLKELLGISPRRVTVSTCGIVPNMYRLASEGLPITLSVSLHAPDDRLRSSIMPVNKVYPVADILEAMHNYVKVTGRRVSIEYALIRGLNDSPEVAGRLAKLAGRDFHVNLIPVNPVAEKCWEPPGEAAVEAFRRQLEKNRVNVTVRRSLGLDIDGSCGQLRRRTDKDTE